MVYGPWSWWPSPHISPWCKQLFVLDPHIIGATVEPVFLAGSRFFVPDLALAPDQHLNCLWRKVAFRTQPHWHLCQAAGENIHQHPKKSNSPPSSYSEFKKTNNDFTFYIFPFLDFTTSCRDGQTIKEYKHMNNKVTVNSPLSVTNTLSSCRILGCWWHTGRHLWSIFKL